MPPKTFVANVKSVLSGDTLVLTSPNNPTLEKTFSLAFVSAPRLSKDVEEAFAFQSREALRTLALNKQVQCTVLYTVPTSQREYGTALVRDGPELPDALVKAGWLKVREDAGRKEESEEVMQRLENLRTLESQAKGEGKGLWAGTGGTIEVQNGLGPPSFLQEWKGKTVDGIVERVFSGDRLLVRLLLSDKKHVQVTTLVAGIRTPATARVIQSTGQSQPAEEYGKEAQTFVEQRLLQRQVKVHIVGASSQGQLVAGILHPRGNIAVFLLEEGLARCNDFHSTMLGDKMAELRAAEKRAQDAKKRLHKHHVTKAVESSQDATVSKIISADTILVRPKSGPEKRINFSSVRGPRSNEPGEAAWRDEAKEALRKKLIGKHVQVRIDGSKAATDDYEARDVATVTHNGKNVGLSMVQEGFCSVIRHRKDDTDRAPNYDELLAAQETAKEEKKGIWSGKPPKTKQLVDASESVQRAKIQASTLQRQRKVPGIVDFCKSGSRFTILVPREGIKLTLVLAGIRAPRAPGRANEDKGEPLGQEALDFANKRCNQRDCEIDIHDVDKVGGFIGELFINRESFGKALVEEGLASVHQYSAEKSGIAAELNAAEKRAKEERKGMWHDWDPSQEQEAEEEAAAADSAAEAGPVDSKPLDYRDIVVTDIDASGKLKIQEVGKGTAALETLMSEFRRFHMDPKNNVAIKDNPKAGDFVAAKFSLDNQWYRARIRSNDRAAKVAEVVYIDYGNSERIPWAKLRPLDQERFGTQKLKAQAVDAVLSFVQLPVSPDYLRDAVAHIARLTEDKQLVGRFDFVDAKEGVNYITIFDPKSGGDKGPTENESLNLDVVLNGHAMVPRKLKAWERGRAFEGILTSLREAEKEAKEGKYGMWEYGDITED